MASKRTKFAVGLFISGGISLAVAALIFLGATQFYKKGQHYLTFFDESVQGLTPDAPVKYRGVPIGRVERIQVAPDSKLVEVVLKIESGQKLDKDIVAQLVPVGITGSVFVELDQKKEGAPDRSPQITFSPDYPVIPSQPSEISNILSGIEAAFKQIQSVDLEGIPEKIVLTLDTLTRSVEAADVGGLSRDLRHILERKRWDRIMASLESAGGSLKETMAKTDGIASKGDQILARMDKILAENEASLRGAVAGLQQTAEGASAVAVKGEEFFARTDERVDQLYRHLLAMGKAMERAAENLNRLTDLLSGQPSLLFFGRPPEDKAVEPEGGLK